MENRPSTDVKGFQFSAIDCGSTSTTNSYDGFGVGLARRDLDFWASTEPGAASKLSTRTRHGRMNALFTIVGDGHLRGGRGWQQSFYLPHHLRNLRLVGQRDHEELVSLVETDDAVRK
jgi:hypothetical protein